VTLQSDAKKICVTSRKRTLTVNLGKATRFLRNMRRDGLWSGSSSIPTDGRKFFQRCSFQIIFGPHTASRRIDTGYWTMKVKLPLLPNADAKSTSNHL